MPRFELAGDENRPAASEEDEEDDIYGAAYEGVTFRGSTEDDFEGEMLEGRRHRRQAHRLRARRRRPSGSSAG